MWGRMMGVVFGAPFLCFLGKRRISGEQAPRLAGLFVLGGLQGALGWYMVRSGLADRIEVSQYRLVAHLVAAVAIYLAALWVALDLLAPRREGDSAGLGRPLTLLLGLAGLTLIAGGFVAGGRG